MHRLVRLLATSAVAISLTACAAASPLPAGTPLAGTTPTGAAAGRATTPTGAAATGAATPTGPAAGAGTPRGAATAGAGTPTSAVAAAAAAATTRATGTVQTLSGDTVTLGDGTSFSMTSETRILHTTPVTVNDIQTGDVVAIAATKQDDTTLLATLVNVFPASLRSVRQGQTPLDGANLMTNATVAKVADGGFTVTYPNGTAQVKLSPDAKLAKLGDGTVADVKVGSLVTALINNGVARSLTVR